MKKQLFLLSLLSLFAVTSEIVTDSCGSSCSPCETKCETKCTTNNSCDKECLSVHGKSFLRTETTFTNGAPIYVSMFNTNAIRNLHDEDQHGSMQLVVFGGKNTSRDEAGCYFFPYGHTKFTVDGSVSPKTHASVLALSAIEAGAVGVAALNAGTAGDAGGAGGLYNLQLANADNIGTDRATFKFDANKDTSILRPWNFGITHAALFEPAGASASGQASGTGLVTNPVFKSTIAPEYEFSRVGAGFALRYHFSDDKDGWWGSMSTSVERVSSHICLNETDKTDKKELTDENFKSQVLATANRNIYGVVATGNGGNLVAANGATSFDVDNVASAPLGAVHEAYINEFRTTTAALAITNTELTNSGTGFPVGSSAPVDMATAFNQDAWNYGKISPCPLTKTRLADIELTLGYHWTCSDCATTDWYVGLVIPTGNKPCATYLADPVVGNGQHAGLMAGSRLDLTLCDNEDRRISYRLDSNGRYLFRNTQKRSFDLKGNEWSRYMMVWENEDAYKAAVDNANALNPAGNLDTDPNLYRKYTPGINVFTQDMKVKPGFHGRLNQAIVYDCECMNAELGWNVFARSGECVEFDCTWDNKPAFADASYRGGLGLNNNRTIYNDSQLTSVNAVDNFFRKENTAGAVKTLANADLASSDYSSFAITEDDVDLNSAASACAVIHAPYLALGYKWDCECAPKMSVGAQYEFSEGNKALQQWTVWGKFEFAF